MNATRPSLIPRETIIRHFQSLAFWEPIWQDSAVAIVGSSALGVNDPFADVDILAFVPRSAYERLYENHRQAVQCGQIEVLNPAAFDYDEFPLTLIPDIKGHYKVETFEHVASQIATHDDVSMWIHANGLILHDPSGRYAQLQARASTYPESVWREKVRHHFLKAWNAASAAGNPLRRDDYPAVALTMTACVAHLLRLCCLLDRQPYPYDKWLYREALGTRTGRDLKHVLEGFFHELRHPEIRRIKPQVYERPGHRNADLEVFPLYRLWRQAKNTLDQIMPVWVRAP